MLFGCLFLVQPVWPISARSSAMDVAQVLIFIIGWIFFAAWAAVLAALSVLAFGRDILRPSQPQTAKGSHS